MIEVAIDCSNSCSMALKCPKGTFSVDAIDFGRASDRDFLPRLHSFLNERSLTIKDIEGWTIGIGPGSFAGIRFSLALVKGICTVTHAKARGIASSYAIVKGLDMTRTSSSVCVIQNARCGKLFASCYKVADGRCIQAATPAMLDANEIPKSYGVYCTPDSELQEMLKGVLPSALSIVPNPSAKHLLDAHVLDWPWQDTPDIDPIYVRPPA
ncbi:MAG: tRNA (adenosine(37)-N6)-threonylcarbamoyltransferase complex dimerization subunit type 1 TsaB [Victivallales bacterium]|nr:tRNA (adenosine(37)-N6)-threonylcarbamoyltransferase complex dimerization subunit type 1 TsaB [Victivallales bacterium]